MFTQRSTQKRRRRRGGIYLIVVSTTLIVSVLAMAALMTVRVQRRMANNTADLRQARLAARAGIEMGLLRIKNDANWRTTYSNGVWESNQPVGVATYTLSGTDPVDSDLDDSVTDPLVLSSSGTSGSATQKLEVTVETVEPPIESLSTAVHCAGELKILGSQTLTVTGAPASTNGNLKINGTLVGDGECNTVTSPENATGTVTTGAPSKPMPDSGVITTYIGRATTLAYIGDFDKHVLAPGLNTYGGGLNSDGVYYINTGNSDVTIKATRIHGTLIIDPGNAVVTLDDAAFLHPYRSDYPTLIVKGELVIKLKSDEYGLDESSWTTNFNPSGAPYLGSTDSDQTDTYPNEVQGLVHATGAVSLEETSRVRGVVLGESTVEAKSTNEIVYDSLLFSSPPDGYTDPPVSSLTRGTWRRVVD